MSVLFIRRSIAIFKESGYNEENWKNRKSNRMRQEASYMAAKEQLTAMEMIWGFMSGTTGHMGKTDFAPQKGSVRRILHLRKRIFRAWCRRAKASHRKS